MKKKLLIYIIFICVAIYAKAQNAETIDKIVAIVGNKIIMMSDVEAQYWQIVMSGEEQTDELKCEVLEELVLQKMLLTQAEFDSLSVSDDQVNNEIDRRLRYFIAQLGSPEALEKYYNKSIPEIRDEFKDLIKNQMLVQQMQNKITTNVKISPTEVKKYFQKLNKDSIPTVESEYEIGKIAITPDPSTNDKKEILEKITDLRNRIIKGENFETLARMYSEDPGSAKKGGEIGLFSRGQMYPEFEGAAFALKKTGDISEIVETPAGFHFMQLIERRGDFINVRHILFIAKASPIDIYNAKLKLDTIFNQISIGKINFADASNKYNIEEDRTTGGLMINQYSGNNKFKTSEIEQNIFQIIDKMEIGSISKPTFFKNESGKDGYRIFYLKSRTNPHIANLEEDYNLISQLALETKKKQALERWIIEKKKSTYVKIMNDFDFCIFKHNWN